MTSSARFGTTYDLRARCPSQTGTMRQSGHGIAVSLAAVRCAQYADTKRRLYGGGDTVHAHLRDLEDSIKSVNSESIFQYA
jgi:hypothetical protein